MKNIVKPTSVRLDVELLEELDQRCKKVGCSRNDFIKNSVELTIRDQSNFNFGSDEEIGDEQIEKIEEKLRIFDCESGNMYENGIIIGSCSNYHLDQGKVFDKNGKQIGIINPKPKITRL